MNPKEDGFTLIEILLYVAILGIIAGLFTGILTVATRFQVHEAASNEVSQQLNFTLQTIQRLVRESSNIEFVRNDDPATIEVNEGDNQETSVTEYAYLKLRMKDSAKDPTCISLVEENSANQTGAIRVTQGADNSPQNCKDSASTDDITTPKVAVSTASPAGLLFTKFANPPGHDTIQIDLTLNYNTTNPQSLVQRKLSTAIGRASAATFDSSLTPGSAATFDIGDATQIWQNLYVQNIKGQFTEGENYAGGAGGGTRGYMAIAAFNSFSCDTVCGSHGLSCNLAQQLFPPSSALCSNSNARRLCFCQ